MSKAQFWMVKKSDANTATVYVYGDIGYEVKADGFVAALDDLAKEYANINVRINTNGGCMFTGWAILNAMRRSRAWIETYVDGLAASMGSVIMLGGKKVHISKVARIMTHKASTVACGGASSLRATADLVDGMEGDVAAMYSEKTGLPKEEARAKYFTTEDRWITAEQALSERLVDSIYDADDAPAISIPKNATSDEVVNIYKTAFHNHFNPDNQSDMKKVTLTITDELASQLGLPANGANAEDAQVQSAITTLHGKALRAEGLSSQLAQLKVEKDAADQKLTEAAAANTAADIKNQLDTALDIDKKITAQLHAELGKQYAGRPVELKALLASMTGFKSVVDGLAGGGKELPAKFQGKTFMELHRAGMLEELKAKHSDHYTQLETEWKNSKD